MLKLVKWAFQLGQQTERRRVQALLDTYRHEIYESSRFEPEAPDKVKKQIERAANQKVSQVIGRIVDTKSEYVESFSLLYPKGRDND